MNRELRAGDDADAGRRVAGLNALEEVLTTAPCGAANSSASASKVTSEPPALDRDARGCARGARRR